jgi:transcriptional regulator with AAA-type ATPase domain
MHDAEVESDDTLKETGGGRRARRHLALPHLFLVLECARPWAGAARHDLSQIDEIRIGRGAKRSVSRPIVGNARILDLRVPDPRMSKEHARIVRVGSAFRFEDLGSTNGSRVRRAIVSSAVMLGDGDVLEIGRTFFRFRAALGTPPGTPADLDSAEHPALDGFATLLPALAESHEALAKIAPSKVSVLLLGETGTGKEVLARALHAASGHSGMFVAVNCGAIPPGLVESHLFGHVRGAFSGATRDEPGFVRSAHQGTLFLDEIGDLPAIAQPALLRVLQDGEVVPVGSSRPESVDLRVICATHHDLEGSLEEGTFREDLFARLAGLTHRLPPLRDRFEDLGLLVAAMLAQIAPDRARTVTLTPDVARRLLEHDWPLNVRELRQALSVAMALAGGGPIDVDSWIPGRPEQAARQDPNEDDNALHERLVDELRRAKGNVTVVARSMGKARMQVQRWMKRFHIDPAAFRPR